MILYKIIGLKDIIACWKFARCLLCLQMNVVNPPLYTIQSTLRLYRFTLRLSQFLYIKSTHIKKQRPRKFPQPLLNFISCRLPAICGYTHYASHTQTQPAQCSLNYKLLTINSCLENIKTCNKILI